MKTLTGRLAASSLLVGSLLGHAATFDGSTPLLCAVQTVSQCDAGAPCEAVTPARVNVPDFLQIDVRSRIISATPETGIRRQTVIDYSEQLDGKLVLQGADDGIEDVRDGLAWSLVIDDTSGKLVLSAAGDGFALVGFGACTLR